MAFLSLVSTNNQTLLKATGKWNKKTATSIETEIAKFAANAIAVSIIDLRAITEMDTSGALLLYKLQDLIELKTNSALELLYDPQERSWARLLKEVGAASSKLAQEKSEKPEQHSWTYSIFTYIGRLASVLANDLYSILYLIGSIAFALPKKPTARRNPPSIFSRLAPFIQQLNNLGVKATPIVMLLAFIIGAIMAQQGAFQLRNFGAEIFVVDLTGILIFRELGVLITAILIAGRCGSAITAELGVMKMREEIDALQVMGFDVFKVLYLPRIAALVVSLPLLTIFANIAALSGAAVMIHYYSHISYKIFLTRIQNDIYFSTYLIGFIKSPFLALLIALIAVMEGLKIKDSTQILGQKITNCVVKSIFCVIVIDGIFAMILAWLNY